MGNINIEGLIAAASSRLGVSPEELRKALGSGDISAVTEKLSPSDRQKVDAVMKNPELAKKISGISSDKQRG